MIQIALWRNWLAQEAYTFEVGGSSPSNATKLNNKCINIKNMNKINKLTNQNLKNEYPLG